MAENSTTEEKKTTTASTTSTTSSTSSSSPTKINTKEIQKRNMQMFINKLSKFELHQADAMIVAIRIAKESKTADKLTREERKALNAYFCAGFVNNWPPEPRRSSQCSYEASQGEDSSAHRRIR